MIDAIVAKIQEWGPAFTFGGFVACIVILVVGWIAKKIIKKRLPLGKLSPNKRELVSRVVSYAIFLLTLALALIPLHTMHTRSSGSSILCRGLLYREPCCFITFSMCGRARPLPLVLTCVVLA